MSRTHAFRNPERGVLRIAGAENNLVVRIILQEEAFQVLLEFGLHVVNGLQDGDWRQSVPRKSHSSASRLRSESTITSSSHQHQDKKYSGASRAEQRDRHGEL